VTQLINLQTKVVSDSSLLWADVDGEVVMMNTANGLYHNLNEIGSAIWQRLTTPIRVEDLCEALECDYDAPKQTIQAQVLALLSKMLERRLIHIET
jgi:hypothetical protein